MTTYLYCIRADATGLPDGLVGIDGANVHAIEINGMSAWVSDVAGPVDATVDRLKAHDAVCAAAMTESDTPLPIRFGQTFADDTAARAAVAERESALRARLARIAGCVEMRIVVTRGRDADVGGDADASHDATESSEAAQIGPGTAFLQRLAKAGREDLAREVGCEAIRHAVRTAAKSLVVDQQRCESARGVSFFPVLVTRRDVDAFRDAVAEILSSQRIDLSVLGPFAPYSFAGDA
jgi:hypothetical protein